MARRGRPTTSTNPEAVRKRERRKRQQESRVLRFEIALLDEDAETWLEIMKEEAASNNFDGLIIPSWTKRTDETVIRKVTQAYLERWCREHRIAKGDAMLSALYHNIDTGRLEADQPPGLKLRGAPVRRQHLNEAEKPFAVAVWVGNDSKKEPLFNPKGVKKDPGRSLSPEEIAAYEAEHPEELQAPDNGGSIASDDEVRDGNDDGFDGAENFMGDGNEEDGTKGAAYLGFEDEPGHGDEDED